MFDINILMKLLQQRGMNPFQGGFGGLYGGGQGFAGHQPQGLPLGLPGGPRKPPQALGRPSLPMPKPPQMPQARNPFAGFAMGQRGRQQLY